MTPSFKALQSMLDNWNTRFSNRYASIAEKLDTLDEGGITQITDEELIELAQLNSVCEAIESLIDNHDDGASFDDVVNNVTWEARVSF